ncbi:MAG: glycosyltransferase family 2 protein [Kiritimatiellia bacterium]
MKPLVSVVIPTYNCARYVVEAVESVLTQTFDRYEVIVVDDGSTDATASVLTQFGERIHYLPQDNLGAAVARNTGIARAQGDYIAFLDADDRWRPEKLARQMRALQRDPHFKIVHTDSAVIDADGRVISSSANRARQSGNGLVFDELFLSPISVILTSSALVARECIEEVGGFDPRFPTFQDHHFFLRLAFRCPVFYIAESLVEYRIRAGSLTRSDIARNIREQEQLLRDIVAAYSEYFDAKPGLLRRRWTEFYWYSGLKLFYHGAVHASRSYFRRCLTRRTAAWPYFLASFLPAGLLRRLRHPTHS